MTKIFILINHKLTNRQIEELKNTYGYDAQFIYPPENVKQFWAQIPPTPQMNKKGILNIIEWLKHADKNDIILVQGDFSATFIIVDYSLKNGLIPIQSVTKRIETEEYEGEKVYKHYIFEHECFRKYEYFH